MPAARKSEQVGQTDTTLSRRRRHTRSLPCPRCASNRLDECDHEGSPLQICTRCRGLWCEPWTWNTERLGDPPAVGPFLERAPDIVSKGPSEIRCPRCDVPLTLLRVDAVEHLEIDQCDRCAGVWFDFREWEYLEALRTWQAHREKTERPTSWGAWFFQFLLRLPVEFNVPPKRFPIITLTLVLICVVIHILGGFGVFHALAVRPQAFESPRGMITLLGYLFVHGNWIHLIGNAYFLYVVGDNVEDVLGSLGFLGLFVLCGVASAGAHIALNYGTDVPLIGASGAIAGIMAAYLILFHNAKLTFMLVVLQLKVPVTIWLGVWFVVQIFWSVADPTGEQTSVGWTSHVAGFVCGFAVVFPLRHWLSRHHALLYLLRTRRL